MGMELDPRGEVGPVRVQWARRRQSRLGPDYRVPAAAALRYVAELERAGVPPRDIAGMHLEAEPDKDFWEWETTNFSPVVAPPFLSGLSTQGPGGHIPDGTGPHGRGLGPGGGRRDGSGLSGITSESMRKPILSVFPALGAVSPVPPRLQIIQAAARRQIAARRRR